MVGIQKMAELVYNCFAKAAIKKWKLTKLIQKYCNEHYKMRIQPMLSLGNATIIL